MRTDPIRILAISGSLRSASSNSVLLRVAAILAPEEFQIFLYEGLGDLPHFNPDFDGDEPCASVADFRNRLREADGVLISTPEYAHGVPGVLKNALDWLVRSGEFVDKPVCIINHLPRGEWALASLKEILTVMMACLIEETSFTLPLPSNNTSEAGIAADEKPSRILYDGITRFGEAIRDRHKEVGAAS
jgi:NAD(P)H-dependent FMN reductase